MRRKDGGWRWFEGTNSNLLHDPDVGALICNGHDVTERKQEEERLAFQSLVLAQMSEPVVAVDRHSIVTYWNDAAVRLFGWTAGEVLGKNSADLFQPQYLGPGGYEALVAALRSTRSWSGEIALRTKAGGEVVVEASIRQLPETLAGITVMKDVTARKQLEDQLRQSQKMEAIGLLAGGVAHDFNNLLAVIMASTEFATRGLPPAHPVDEHLQVTLDAAQRGGALTRKLLAFSRKQIIQPRPLDVRAAVDEFTRMLGRIVGEDVELVVERGADLIVVRADSVQLEQVLLNLCTNARQAMPDGGRLRLATRAVAFDASFVARHPWARVGSFAELVVSDTGVGMDEATRAHVFEPFFTTKPDGTGLGLATAYGIVQQHGGFMHIESAPGAGTTFRVFLPMTGDDAQAVESFPRARHGGIPRGHETILLAEDEPALRSLVTTTLSELGYRVISTSDGEEAVREYTRRAKEIALVVMDVVMPRLDAREAYLRMRVIRPDVKVLFATGYAPESTRLAELLQASPMFHPREALHPAGIGDQGAERDRRLRGAALTTCSRTPPTPPRASCRAASRSPRGPARRACARDRGPSGRGRGRERASCAPSTARRSPRPRSRRSSPRGRPARRPSRP